MIYSIRFKLFAALCCLIVFFVILFWFFNSVLLEKYYLYNKKSMLLESYNEIAKLYNGDSTDFSLELEKLENSRGLHVIIVDKDFNVLYNSRQRDMNFGLRRRIIDNQNLAGRLIKEKINQISQGKPFIETRLDTRLSSYFITLYSQMSDEVFVSISTPVAAIQESAEIANQFFVFTGVLILIIGGVLIFFITSKFTRPILELNGIAQRMSKLDFSKRYPVKTKDEIGYLGQSINSLSEQLEKSIHELKAANRKLQEDIEKERKIDEMRKGFITNVSHELKTPIALIQGYAEGLKLNVNEDEENKNYYCDVIMDESFKMNKLVRQLLDLSQIESGALVLDKSDFNISELVECVLKKNSIVFKEKDIHVIVEGLENIIVQADYECTEQVLTNYIINAVNHVDEHKHIKVGIAPSGKKVRISVFNSGRHIPAESIDKIWLSFYKVDKARTRAYGGTGLGLSIVRAIQEAHGNAYGAENQVFGVEFWFEVDIAE